MELPVPGERDERRTRTESTALRARSAATPPQQARLRPATDTAPATGAPDLNRYWSILRTRWRIALGIFGAIVAAVAVGTWMQTPIYRATGTIEIRKQSGDVVPAEALFQSERVSEQYLETQYAVLRSPSVAKSVIAELGGPRAAQVRLLLGLQEEATAPGVPADLAEARALAAFEDLLLIDPVRGTRLVRVGFESANAELAAQAANLVLASYIDTRVEDGQRSATQLAEQVDSIRAQLAGSERRLQEYVRTNDLVFLENGAGETESIVNERLRHLQQQLTEAEADRYRKEAAYNLVRQQGNAYLDSNVLQSLSVRVAELRSEYAKLRATFSDRYPATQQVKGQLDELEAMLMKERRRKSEEISSDYAAAVQRQALLRTAFDEQKGMVDRLAAKTAEYQVLKRDVEGNQQLYATLQQKRREAGITAALAASEVGIVDVATPPLTPIRPSPQNLPLAAVVGLVLGIGAAFLREHTDPTVRTLAEIDSAGDLPLLATIPSVRRLSTDNRSSAAEAFNALRHSIISDVGRSPRSLLVTSVQPRDGKSTISINLAISLAHLGTRVLLIDADTRRPSVQRVLGMQNGAGLIDHLTGRADWRTLVQQTDIPGLDVLPSSVAPSGPTEMLSSRRMAELVREAETAYAYVVIDAPALFINAADARILAPLVDGVVLVIRSGATPREMLKRVLPHAPNLIGVVLNDLDVRYLPASYDYYSLPDGAGAGTGNQRDRSWPRIDPT
jgi:capsular exopolysaccharide synthesis family protein